MINTCMKVDYWEISLENGESSDQHVKRDRVRREGFPVVQSTE